MGMSDVTLSADELLAWSDTTAEHWKRLIEAHPEALQLPCDVAGVRTAGELLQHIVAAELRLAERLHGAATVTPPEEISYDSAEAIYRTHDRASSLFRQLLADKGYDWSEKLEFTARMGKIAAPRKVILFHALLHGIRHYAQLATVMRQNGIKPDWPMDYLFMAGRS
jgi:uncharacterized damage-inducible protein DinB